MAVDDLPRGLDAAIEALIDAAREACFDDETVAAAFDRAATALREGLT